MWLGGGRRAGGGPLRSPWPALALAALTLAGLAAGSGYAIAPNLASGRVVDVHGRPVPDATVRLRQGSMLVASTTTPVNGRFQLSGGVRLRGGSLEVEAPGYLPEVVSPGPALVLHSRPLVSGRSFDSAGPIAQAHVTLELSGGATLETMTAGDGTFTLHEAVVPGSALVTVTAPGRDAYRESLQLVADTREEIAAALPLQVAFLELSSDPAGAAPTLDGGRLADCPATPCTATVAPGNHVVGLGGDLYVPWSAPVALFEGSHLALGTTLVRKTGTLRVAGPGDADGQLLVDGQRVPSAGWTGTVPTGSHTVSYSSAERWPWAASVNVDWNQETAVTVSAPAVNISSDSAFLAGMTAYLSSLPGSYGVYISDLRGGRVIAYHAGDSMEAASVIKLPVALYIEQQAQAGALKMDDQVALEDGDFMGGTGTLDGTAGAGDKYSYKDLLALLIQQSDNTAWQALDRVLGKDKVDAYAASIGAGDCRQDDDQCTASEAGQMMARLAAGSVLDAAHTKDLLGLLENTAFNDRINYYLPGVTIAHKVGMDGGVINDVGVVYGSQPFVVSVLTDSDDPDQGVQVIRLVARAAAQLFAH